MFDLAAAAVDGAVGAGATYADARIRVSRNEGISALNGEIESISQDTELGVGVRALFGSAWGFAAAADPTEAAARRAGAEAAAIARASALVGGSALAMPPVTAEVGEYHTPRREDPFSVALADKCDLLVAVTGALVAEPAVALGRAMLSFWEVETWLTSSAGHRIHQVVVQSGGGMSATAVGETETQRRSYPQAFGHYETGGYEVIRGFDLLAHTGRVASEAAALLTAPPCPAGTTDLVLESSQVALQIHESVGHAIELDRILGWEASLAGTSFLSLDQLGSLRYGSPLMEITADATIPGALGTFGYDDEGTPAQSVDIVREGTWVGVLSGRDSAAVAGVAPGGMVRGEGYGRIPMVRMTNVGLVPGTGDDSLAAIIDDTGEGVYLATNRSWSIDDKRLNFQFGCEIAWEIRNGKLGRMLRNPIYTGITPQFWGALDRRAGPDEWRCWGVPNCGKGQPIQTARTGHGAAPARFRGVRVGVSA